MNWAVWEMFSPQDESVFELIINTEMLKRGYCRTTVGRVLWVGDSDLLDRRMRERFYLKLLHVDGRFYGNPRDDPANGVSKERARFG